MSGNEVDEVARSWAQLFRMLIQLRHQARMLGGSNTIRLSRAEHKEFARQIEQTVLIHQYAHDTSREWFQARVRDYQREAAAVRARLDVGVNAEQHERMTAYLSGLRNSIEHTVHDAPLTTEERGQTVQALAAIDTDPREPVAHNIFRPLTKTEAARARLAAVTSEYRVMQHRERLTAAISTHDHPQPAPNADADTVQWREQNTQLLGTLNKRIAVLEQKVSAWQAREKATASAQPNGHGTQRKEQRAEQAMPASSRPVAEQVQEQHADSGATHPQPGTGATEASVAAEEELDAEMPTEWAARMQAEA